MAAVCVAIRLAAWAFPAFTLGWLAEEMRELLPQELDFEHEAANAERCRTFFSAGGGGAALRGSVVVPDVLDGLSSTRVLTMSFEEGSSVVDRRAIERMALDPAAVVRLLSATFCAQVRPPQPPN